jgi:hypothetical protein
MDDSRLTRLTNSLPRARDVAFLLALRHPQIGQNHLRILFERQLDGVAQGELEGRGILRESAGGERQ